MPLLQQPFKKPDSFQDSVQESSVFSKSCLTCGQRALEVNCLVLKEVSQKKFRLQIFCSFQLINDKIACCSLLRRFPLQESCSPNKKNWKTLKHHPMIKEKKEKSVFDLQLLLGEKQLLLLWHRNLLRFFAWLWKKRNKKRRKRREYDQWRTMFLLKKKKWLLEQKKQFFVSLKFWSKSLENLTLDSRFRLCWITWGPTKETTEPCKWRVWNIGVILIKIS